MRAVGRTRYATRGSSNCSSTRAMELFLLAVASAFWPVLVAVVVIALRTSQPVRLLLGFLVGGLLTTVAIGYAIVASLKNASFVTESRPPADPIFYFTAGVLFL